MPTMNESDHLERSTVEAAERSGISRNNWQHLLDRLTPLRLWSPDMYQHSLRVGLVSYGLARFEGMDSKLALHGGCAHDIGKCKVAKEVIYAKNFGATEREAMSVHPEKGYEMLKGENLFSAFIAGLHHTFQDPPYGIDLDAVAPWLPAETRGHILAMAELVATVDYRDALMTRPSKDGEYRTNEQVNECMATRFGDTRRVRWLADSGGSWR